MEREKQAQIAKLQPRRISGGKACAGLIVMIGVTALINKVSEAKASVNFATSVYIPKPVLPTTEEIPTPAPEALPQITPTSLISMEIVSPTELPTSMPAQACPDASFYHPVDDAYSGIFYFPGELNSSPAYQQGRANHYGDGESLNTFTSTREVFDPNKMAAASWFYPLGTKVMVKDLATGRTIVVVINDRGPDRVDYPDVIIDLTTGAIRSLSATDDSLNVSVVPICP